MKVRRACAAVVLIGASLLLLSGIRCAQAAEIKIVSPSAYEDMEGEGGGGGETSSPFHFQQVFPAEDFAALGDQPHWLVGWTVRPDQSVTSPRTAHFPDNEVRLSTTQLGPDDLSLQFDDNLGPDVMQFYRGPLNLVADIDGTSPVPREFYHADFPAGVAPFLYDPSQGNLLFDAIAWQGASPSTRDDEVPGILTAVASSSFATQGSRDGASIFQFTFIPMISGDYNGDGMVDGRDLANWIAGFGTTGNAMRLQGDADGDLDVDGADILVWQRHVGSSTTSTGEIIPEPTALVILVTGVLVIVSRRVSARIKLTYRQAWMACGLLLTLPAAAQADIFRWDNGQLIPVTEGITPGPGVDLSQWTSMQRNLRFADFSGGLDLTQANFWQSWLDNSRFNGANLTNASLQSANLTNADLSGANLTDANLHGSSLTNANLSAANLTDAYLLRANVANANHSGAVVTGANFSEATSRGFTKEQLYSTASYQQKNLRGIGLRSNDLTGWNFSGQDLTGADLGVTTLTSANFAGAVVAGTEFSYFYDEGGITLPQLYSTASYQQKNLRGIRLNGNDLTGWDFSGQDLAGADFTRSTLTNAGLQSAILTNAVFSQAILTNADLSGADLTDADLGGEFLIHTGANLTNVNLTGAIVTGASFFDTTSRGFTKEQLYSTASYRQRNLRQIVLFGNDLTGWDFSGRDLTGASFGQSTLTSANFAGAVIAGANFSYYRPFGESAGITRSQLYSTASYQQRNLRSIVLAELDLTSWDFSGQDLTDANLDDSTLTNANL